MTNNRKMMEDAEAYHIGERYDMCEALQGIREDGIEIGIRGMVLALRECGVTDGIIRKKLIEKFSLPEGKAEMFLQNTERTEEIK